MNKWLVYLGLPVCLVALIFIANNLGIISFPNQSKHFSRDSSHLYYNQQVYELDKDYPRFVQASEVKYGKKLGYSYYGNQEDGTIYEMKGHQDIVIWEANGDMLADMVYKLIK